MPDFAISQIEPSRCFYARPSLADRSPLPLERDQPLIMPHLGSAVWVAANQVALCNHFDLPALLLLDSLQSLHLKHHWPVLFLQIALRRQV